MEKRKRIREKEEVKGRRIKKEKREKKKREK